jgi:UDP-N-acetylglucosamine 2-epimerase (non-hydrolysing)
MRSVQCGEAKRIATIIGTRPEAIKLAPVVHAFSGYPSSVENIVISTGQHREMLDQALSLFEVTPQVDLELMQQNQDLSGLSSRVTEAVSRWLQATGVDLVLVQGDTGSALAAALAAFYQQTPVAHVEAGLRSFDLKDPWPEEGNRKMISALSELHFCATPLGKEILVREGVQPAKICVTGNTAVDALKRALKIPFSFEDSELRQVPFGKKKIALVTSHRRESWGRPLENICLALTDLVKVWPELYIIYPVHLNPNVQKTVLSLLGKSDKILLTKPLDYLTFINVMKCSDVILTDSGGIQEEAPSLGKPLLLLRERTERPEAYQSNLAAIVGTDRERIVRETTEFLLNPPRVEDFFNPYGDGRASGRIAKAVNHWLTGEEPLLSPEEEFENLVWMKRSCFGTVLSPQP